MAPKTKQNVFGRLQSLFRDRRQHWPAGSLTIGRLPSRDMTVGDALVSRVHAVLVPTAAGLAIQDNNSSNGTFVNDERIDRELLHEGDMVTVGNADFAFSGKTLVPRPVDSGVAAHRLGLSMNGHQSLADVSFTASPGTLTAIIGPSGAGKSSLIRLLGGAVQPSSGVVTFDRHNTQADHALVRSRIRMVPQDDAVHHQLTVEQALGYAAKLRLPSDTSAAERRQVMHGVIDELELRSHRTTKIGELSIGQRKRISVAMELLTQPAVLLLDEPDPRLDRPLGGEVMAMARQLADAGRVVVAVPRSRHHLHLCEQLVLLTSGGRTAFVGPPEEIEPAMGTADWVDILARVGTDPDGTHDAFLARRRSIGPPPQPPASTARPRNGQGRQRQASGIAPGRTSGQPSTPPARSVRPRGQAPTSRQRQISGVARRYARLVVANRGYFAFLAMLPFLLGALSLVVSGAVGFEAADPYRDSPGNAVALLVTLNIAAVFMGAALSIGDLVGEGPVFRYEQSVGLSASAYLVAKIIVFGLAAIIQTVILVAIVVAVKGPAVFGAVSLGKSVAALYLAVATTAVVSSIVGLGLSSLVRRKPYTLPLFVVTIMVSLVFCGGMFPLADQPLFDQVSWLVPARWGFAASASATDLQAVDPAAAHDRLWTHSPSWWLFDMAMLVLLGAVSAGWLRWRLRRPRHKQHAESAPEC